MVTIKFNKETIQALIDAGLFDQWLANFKKQWRTDTNTSGNGKTVEYFEQCTNPYALITWGFVWEHSNEGHLFWNNIHSKDLRKINKH